MDLDNRKMIICTSLAREMGSDMLIYSLVIQYFINRSIHPAQAQTHSKTRVLRNFIACCQSDKMLDWDVVQCLLADKTGLIIALD